MDPRSAASPEPDGGLGASPEEPTAEAEGPDQGAVRPPDLDTMPVPGITRRRVAFALAAIVSAWIIIVFARQVGEAAAATGRADAAAIQNAALTADVAGIQRELDQVQQQAYILQQARGHRLGTPGEIPFSLALDAPALAADAPGSAAQALGASQERGSPLDTWLRLLFGPGVDG
jgi:cell division protein FtsB